MQGVFDRVGRFQRQVFLSTSISPRLYNLPMKTFQATPEFRVKLRRFENDSSKLEGW